LEQTAGKKKDARDGLSADASSPGTPLQVLLCLLGNLRNMIPATRYIGVRLVAHWLPEKLWYFITRKKKYRKKYVGVVSEKNLV
jgi:hypothetical protein